MNKILIIFVSLFSIITTAQQSKMDSLSVLFHESKIDTTKARLLSEIGVIAYSANPKEARVLNDSLLSFTKEMSNRYYAQALRMKGTYFLLDSEFDDAEEYYLAALKLSNDINDSRLYSGVVANLGTLYGWQDKRELATKYYKKSIKLNDSLGFKQNNVRPYINLAITASKSLMLEKANEYLFEALEIAESNDSNQTGYIYNEIANNYLRLEAYDKAEIFLKKALPIAEFQEDNLALGRINNSLGYLYETRDEDWDKTLLHYEKSLEYHLLMQNDPGIIDGYNNVAIQYIRSNDYQKAEEYLLKSLRLASDKMSKDKMIISSLNLSELYIKQKDKQNSIKYLEQGIELIGDNSQLPYRNHFYRIGNLFADNNSYKIGYENVKKYSILSDSLFIRNNIDKIAEVEAKYKTEKKEKELAQSKTMILKKELELKTSQRFVLISVLAAISFLVVLLFILYLRLKAKLKIEKLKEAFADGFNNYLLSKYKLKNRELNLWLKIVEGFSEKELAEHFFRSIDTIKKWRTSLYSNLKDGNESFKQKNAIDLYYKEKELYNTHKEQVTHWGKFS